jgi:hypothetical protein
MWIRDLYYSVNTLVAMFLTVNSCRVSGAITAMLQLRPLDPQIIGQG